MLKKTVNDQEIQTRTRQKITMRTELDVEYSRSQFPAFDEPSLKERIFCENAGGSYACRQVIERLTDFYRRLKVQPYYSYPASTEAGAWMDNAHSALASYLGVSNEHIHFGPSTSQNIYVLAQAFRKYLKPGDEIVVTNQDHEANSGAWRRLRDDGISVVEWCVDPATGALDHNDLIALLSGRTRLVVFPHCSNIVAMINPVKAICSILRERGIVSIVDGVSYAPHGFVDVSDLGCDAYLFSLYKTFGPHQGLMVIRPELVEHLGNQGHFFNASLPRKRLVPAGPDHAQVAAARGIAEYFDVIDEHHGGSAGAQRPQRVRELLHQAEQSLMQPLLQWADQNRKVKLLGPKESELRAPTFAFATDENPAVLVSRLADQGVMAAAGNFYSTRLLEAIGLSPSKGVLRLSFVHYNTAKEVEKTINALERALSA